MLLSGVVVANSQALMPIKNTVNATTTEDAKSGEKAKSQNDELELCNQRLVKVLKDIEAAEKLIANLKELSAKQSELNNTNNMIIATQNGVIAAQKELIQIYEKRPRKKTKIFWGLISFVTN